MVRIQFSSWRVPLERRLQTLSTLFHVACISLIPFVCLCVLARLLFTEAWFISVGYLTWVVYDQYILKTSRRGGRRSYALWKGRQWDYYRDYFPMTMIKTGDLDPGRNYVMGFHPHGIIGASGLIGFASDSLKFSTLFPGMTSFLLTLRVNFLFPFMRDYALLMGIASCEKESIDWLLTQNGTGNAIVLIVGGAAESLESRPGIHRVVLNNRKGFVKTAIKYGAPLVPVYSFGENYMYSQVSNPPGSLLRTLQNAMKSALSFTLPLFYGRGVFNYTFGFLPRRVAVRVVVGSPLEVPQEEEPQQSTIERVHEQYTHKLIELYEQHKHEYGIPQEQQLEIL